MSAHNSVHIHNGSGLRSIDDPSGPRKQIPESKIHAFLRLDPADHKQVMFAAFLNIVFVWLAEAGRLNVLVSISFDIAPSGSFADRHGFSDDAASILMAAASIFVFWLFAFLGKPYEWMVRHSFRFVRRRAGKKGESPVHSYVRVAR